MTNSYVYKVICIPTGEYYIGFRCRNQYLKRNPEEDLWKFYFSSSKRVKSLIDLHGIDNFHTEILFQNPDKNVCYEIEQKLIVESISDPLNINIAHIKNGVCVYRLPKFTDEQKRKMSEARKGIPRSKDSVKRGADKIRGKPRPEWLRIQMSETKKGKSPHNKGKSPPRLCCIQCQKEFTAANWNKWHRNDCRPAQDKQIENYLIANGNVLRKDILAALGIPENSFDTQIQRLRKTCSRFRSKKFKENGVMTSRYWIEPN